MTQVHISLTILRTYFPEDLGLDENASNEEIYEAADKEASIIADTIQEMANLSIKDIEVEVYESN